MGTENISQNEQDDLVTKNSNAQGSHIDPDVMKSESPQAVPAEIKPPSNSTAHANGVPNISGDNDSKESNINEHVLAGGNSDMKSRRERLYRHLTTLEGDSFPSFTKTLLGSIAITFILELLAQIPNNMGQAAAISVGVLTEHVHAVPASLLNLTAGFAGLILFGRDLPIAKGFIKFFFAPLFNFVLHLLMIGIGTGLVEAGIHLVKSGHKYLGADCVGLLWLVISSAVVSAILMVTVMRPETFAPQKDWSKSLVCIVGAIIAGVFLGWSPIPSQPDWVNTWMGGLARFFL
jgi:hypothetical protein